MRVAVRCIELEELAVLGGEKDDFLYFRAVVDDFLFFRSQVLEWYVHTYAEFLGYLCHPGDSEHIPGLDRAFGDGEILVRDEGVVVDFADDAGALAVRAGAVAVECEGLCSGAFPGGSAYRTMQGSAQCDVQRRFDVMPVRTLVAAQAREHKTQVIKQFSGCAESAAHVRHARPLVQRYRRWNIFDVIDFGAFCLRYASARERRQRLKVAP